MENESSLIKQVIEGSERAFNKVYKHYAPRLYGFCYQWTKSKEDAEEIVQETFIKLWATRNNITNRNSLKPLLFTIAHRQIIDLFRQRVRSVTFEDYLLVKESLQDTSDSLEYEQYMEIVEHSLQLLPQNQQRIFRMSKLEGVPYEEIAKRLNLSVKTIKNESSLGTRTLHDIVTRVIKFIAFFFSIAGIFNFLVVLLILKR